MNSGKEYFSEINIYHHANISIKEKYSRFYLLLDRLCKEITKGYASNYTNLFGRLYAVCRQTHYNGTPIEVFRIHAKQIQRDEFTPTEEDYLYDLKALCEAVGHFTDTTVPEHLQAGLPLYWRRNPENTGYAKGIKRIRFLVEGWDEQFLWGIDEEHPAENPLKADYTQQDAFADISTLLKPRIQLNLLSVTSDESGILYPEIIVFNPDFLIDISSLSACYMNYGNTSFTYLANKFKPSENTRPILLGNAANQFLDDCINEQPDESATYEKSIQKAFRNDILNYCTCPEIDRSYFDEAQKQFDDMKWKIKEIIEAPDCQIDKSGAMLEPSFICESLGIQGRMDFLQCNFHHLIELKSGKAETFNGPIRPKSSHEIQVALYKEILYYNLGIPRNKVTASLYYSKHNMLFEERCSKVQIQHAIRLRNSIVALEMRMKDGEGKDILDSLRADDFNVAGDKSTLWNRYQRPQFEAFLNPFHNLSKLEHDYFHTFLSFVEREQFLSKTGDDRPDSSHGFADLWDADLATKQNNGNILIDMKIESFSKKEGIEKIHFSLPDYDESFLPNFRKGDIVLFYERNTPTDNATNKQVFRCNVESVDNEQITLLLRNKQRNDKVFPMQSLYAMEHDYMESSYTALYKGLYAFLQADERRKDLLLGQREPQQNKTITLVGNYGDEDINRIVLQAKQAQDYFLLVGPPGSGKTSVALKAMVKEFLTEGTDNLLLLSYTNRAVDEICEMLESIESGPQYIRIGSSLSCEKRFENRLIQRFCEPYSNRSEIIRALAGVRIVTGTTSAISNKPELFCLKHFHTAIIDEASQILEPQLLGLLCASHHSPITKSGCAIDKFIFIGDPKQLPAVVLQEGCSAVTNPELQNIGIYDCRNSLFERLYALNRQKPKEGIIAMLHKQGRMHPAVGEFANTHFYHNVLEPIPVAHQTARIEFALYDENDPYETMTATRRTAFIETKTPPREDSNKVNKPEAEEVARYVQAIFRLCEKNRLPFCPEKRIGIIVPFRNQIAMIANELKKTGIPDYEKITIDTVERYQGSQRDIILYSTTISRLYQLDILSVPVETDDTLVDRKMNVAITRAKKQLFVFGESSLLSHSKLYKELIRSLD